MKRQEDVDEYSTQLYQRTEELYQIPDAELDQDGCIELPAIVLHDVVIFPKMVSPIFIEPGPNLVAIQEAQFNLQAV
ncbi:MAG TPA: hypothetical protein VMC62_10630, partial [Longilinea sp.]|nr:hypothetical protein [Longilinea sp.]